MAKAPDLTSLAIPRKGTAAPATAQEPNKPPIAAPIAEDPRTTVSTRLTLSLQKRLRRCAFETEREKQAIIEEALDKYLREQNF